MARVPSLGRSALAAAWLAAGIGACSATDMPAYAPIQTEPELAFISNTLGLQDRIATLRQRTADPVRFEYAMVDLDGDGQSEVFIRASSGNACTAGSCTTWIFNLTAGAWAAVLETSEPEVTVAKQLHRGYRDIVVGSQPWLWTGKAYAPVR